MTKSSSTTIQIPSKDLAEGDRQVVIVWDLDDTLYKEADYVRSGFMAVDAFLSRESKIDSSCFPRLWRAFQAGEKAVFNSIAKETETSVDKLIEIYRFHQPSLELPDVSLKVLEQMSNAGIAMGVLTDGRSKTQRNKLLALGIIDYFDHIVISEEIGSEKPAEQNYLSFETRWPGAAFTYIGDNTAKDFVTAKKLGWKTICVRSDGRNIHPQDFTLDQAFLADVVIDDVSEISVVS